MKIKTVLFDLDGTLLPMDQEEFVQVYFKKLATKMADRFEPQALIQNIWNATKAMIADQSSTTNETIFWNKMQEQYGKEVMEHLDAFDRFYRHEFQDIQEVCPQDPKSPSVIETLSSRYDLILATNPLFPQIATYSRVRWAGLDPEQFMWITTYENSSACKPTLRYYEEILERFALDPQQCLMVGNDVDEDMVAQTLGMHVFLLSNHLINRQNKDISNFPHGNFDDLLAFIDQKQNEAE